MNEANGVRWEYVDDPAAPECADCGRRFVATHWFNDGSDDHCPGCRPVESIGHSMERALDEVDPDDLPRELVWIGGPRSGPKEGMGP